MNLELFIRNKLFTIGLHEETFGEYIAGIITDDSLEESEKREAISEFISGATDNPSESIIDDIFKTWSEFEKEQQETKEAEEKLKQEKETKEAAALQQNFENASTSIEPATISLRNPKKQLTKEERKRREQLLARYSYELDEVVENEDGEAEIQYKDRSAIKEISEDLLQANRNTEQVKQKEQFRREQMRKQHEEEKERNRRQ
ncbi:13649_t:CDS:2 [Funneliformis caledonium]|uniref:13649_t:CDS:1 n=1 Tax=Funneliformis caledonium TaxID=1117310 RepID=A0A9N9B6Z9_9GLOM|nr:13649_t:CDS:2 [Funneliformis caledonium]